MATSPFAAAIAQLEGYGVSGAIPTVANNPGDLELGDIGYGTLTATGGQKITVFPSIEAGYSALENQLSKMTTGTSSVYSPDMTLAQAGTIYSGGSSTYGQKLANALGVPSSTTLGSLAGQGSTGTGTTLSTSSASSGILGWFAKTPIQNIVYIVVGIVIVAAGVFSFKQTGTVIQTVGRISKNAAEVAA